jgi:CheY-like chemotaxis protein
MVEKGAEIMNEVSEFDRIAGGQASFDWSTKTILVVEDDDTHRTLMDKILVECGFRTVPAENGLIALSKIDSGQSFDLIIMDWDMPELNGLETTREIRAREVGQDQLRTPIIAFTANREPGDREQCLAVGMDAYLPKDVWMPRWRNTLVDNLQGLITGNFDAQDFDAQPEAPGPLAEFDLDAFDCETLAQSAALLKDEMVIAVDEYLEDAAAYIRDIRDGLAENDAEKAARGSHPLKSNSKNFGLSAVAQIAEAINNEARKGNLSPVESLLPQLQEAFSRAENKLREEIKRNGY